MLFINVKDVITRDTQINIVGWVSHLLYIKWGVSRLKVELFYKNQKIAETTTNRLGVFNFQTTLTESGLHQYIIKIPNTALSEEATILRLPDKELKPILICDIDNTLAHVSVISFFFRNIVTEVLGAKEVLQGLADKYNIIYLTHRDERLSSMTKNWLSGRSFPNGPVIFWSYKKDPLSSRKYKTKALLKVAKENKIELSVGIGEQPGDMIAYQSAGIKKTFQINSSEDWKKIKEELLHA
jgi:phosphatidate phosphatase APP1